VSGIDDSNLDAGDLSGREGGPSHLSFIMIYHLSFAILSLIMSRWSVEAYYWANEKCQMINEK
jgi:hypothetical protein